jgi:PadR family transcriptional regulator PadR
MTNASSASGLSVVRSRLAETMVPAILWGERMARYESDDLSQLRRGVVEGCVLALLRREERYGLDIQRQLSAAAVVTTDGAIYNVLARLSRDGLVRCEVRASSKGPARRYYRLTTAGVSALDTFSRCWASYCATVDEILFRS